MPTPAERRALLFVATVAALGTAVRGTRAVRADAVPKSDRVALAAQLANVDSLIATGGVRRTRPSGSSGGVANARPGGVDPAGRGTQLSASEPPLDLDIATAAELERLPGIGPALAARIVEDRAERGPFGSIDGLRRVKGIGPALSAKLHPFVTFSLPPRHSDTGATVQRRGSRP